MSDGCICSRRAARGKLRELRPMFAAAGLEVIDLERRRDRGDAAEDDARGVRDVRGERAREGAVFRAKSGLADVADDSGLEVDALGGRRACGEAVERARRSEGQALDDANNRLSARGRWARRDGSARALRVRRGVRRCERASERCRGEVGGRDSRGAARRRAASATIRYFCRLSWASRFGRRSVRRRSGEPSRASVRAAARVAGELRAV